MTKFKLHNKDELMYYEGIRCNGIGRIDKYQCPYLFKNKSKKCYCTAFNKEIHKDSMNYSYRCTECLKYEFEYIYNKKDISVRYK